MMKKIKDFFTKNFDTKRFFSMFGFIIIAFLLIVVINFGGITLSKYISEAEVNVSPDIAFFVTDVGSYSDSIELDKILPSVNPYIYTFTVSNFKESQRTNVKLEYEIVFRTTTNIPLNYKLFRNTSVTSGPGIIATNQVVQNAEGVYFKELKTGQLYQFGYASDQVDTYLLWVEFPEGYKNSPDLYEGVIDLVEITVDAKQVVV